MRDHKATVRNYLARVWHQHDYAAIDENIRADYRQHSRNVPPGRHPVEQVGETRDDARPRAARLARRPGTLFRGQAGDGDREAHRGRGRTEASTSCWHSRTPYMASVTQ
jgi:hypothetical protein